MSQDSTIDFEKRRNVPVRYDRELVQTTIKAMKRIAEIKSRREHAFWKNRSVACCISRRSSDLKLVCSRMAVSREKLLTHRKKKKTAAVKSSVSLLEPISAESSTEKVKEKIKVPMKTKSALVAGEGRSMGMDID